MDVFGFCVFVLKMKKTKNIPDDKCFVAFIVFFHVFHLRLQTGQDGSAILIESLGILLLSIRYDISTGNCTLTMLLKDQYIHP